MKPFSEDTNMLVLNKAGDDVTSIPLHIAAFKMQHFLNKVENTNSNNSSTNITFGYTKNIFLRNLFGSQTTPLKINATVDYRSSAGVSGLLVSENPLILDSKQFQIIANQQSDCLNRINNISMYYLLGTIEKILIIPLGNYS